MIIDTIKGIQGTNNPLMLTLSLSLAATVMAEIALKNSGRMLLANVLVWIAGFPLLMYGFFILLFIIFKPDMR